MTIFEAVLLGLVQGITEFLPISSSAHVQIVQQLLGISDLARPELTAFIAIIQIGTELAVILFFAKTVLEILRAWFSDALKPWGNQSESSRLGWFLIIGSVPIFVLGLALQNLIENQFRSLWVIAFTLIAFGLLLGVADRLGSKLRDLSSITPKSALMLGLGQALALVPGVSRSGGTITVALALGFKRESAARYSFLLAIPAVLAAGTYQFVKYAGDLPPDLLLATLIATAVSFASGLAVIAWLLRFLNRGSFLPFVIWRVSVGILLLVGLSSGWIVDIA
jgi:undecaprenyl-diphosphatase